MEYVDIVDEQNNVIGNASKADAHSKGLLHRVVISEVHDTKNRWLLVRQANDRQDGGQFVSPVGGHVTSTEDPKDALIRETEEELGFKPKQFSFIGQTIFNRYVLKRQEDHLFMLYDIRSDVLPKLNKEAIEYRYFTENELKKGLKYTPKLFGDAFHFIVDTFFPHLRI
ncbi:MAG: NUDIX domain-containing protein [Candidatus Roizmanbacteria bacterium]|nr:NUDIX domain-containing protein [Candidatus Roizmanbacteria bacterium]